MDRKEAEEQNEYAENIMGAPLYILDVDSGRKGYFCIGCKNEMQAVKSEISGRKSYFRHDPHDVKKSERKCVFSNQKYRHDQAVFILNRIKRIKVPILYKYPPVGIDGKAFKIKNSEFIEAKYTRSELTFYETDMGEVSFGKNLEISSRNLLIRPDVTFFNAQNKPILLVEIVVTHSIDHEKLAKIKRLGIDTVQITIPKDSLENIEYSFSDTKNIKWVYNYEEECTEYIFTPNNDSEGISQTDEFQRKFFEESFQCRQFQIKDLIRTIEKCLGSQQYRTTKGDFRVEISRVEKNKERLRNRLEKRRREIRERVSRKFEERRDGIRNKRTRFESEERELREAEETFKKSIEDRREDLDRRYIRKREELDENLREIRKTLLKAEDFGRSELDNREQEGKLDTEIEDVESRIGNAIESRAGLPGKFEQLQIDEQSRVVRKGEAIAKERRKIIKRYREEKKKVQIEAERDRRSEIARIKERDTSGESELSGRIKAILHAGCFFHDLQERTNTLRRNRTALESFKRGTYKNWYRP